VMFGHQLVSLTQTSDLGDRDGARLHEFLELHDSSIGAFAVPGRDPPANPSRSRRAIERARLATRAFRSFTLPEGADLEHPKSELKEGVLTLVIPKKPGAQAKKIVVSTGAAKS
jgi:hypothetical protein